MKKKIYLFIALAISLPQFVLAQVAPTLAQGVPASHEPVITPDKFFTYFGIGLVLAFVLLVFYVLSRATIVLSKTLGEKYKA